MKDFLIVLFGGWFGLHKFLKGKTKTGVLYLFTFGLCGIGWIVDIIKAIPKPKVNHEELPHTSPRQQEPRPVQNDYVFLNFKVAGVTFKNGRKTRQAILRAFRWGDELINEILFEEYEYEGRPAVYVKINEQIIGNIPADHTQTFFEYRDKYRIDNVAADVYGGNKRDDGTRSNYGCEIHIRFKTQ